MSEFRAATGQMCSAISERDNIYTIGQFARKAKNNNCALLSLPECCNAMDVNVTNDYVSQNSSQFVYNLQDIARSNNLWIHAGSVVLASNHGKLANRTLLINSEGDITATYDKIHLFDVNISPENSFRESRSFGAGSRPVVTELPWCKAGLSICYDLRFGYLFRKLTLRGATVLFIPAAFTVTTGAMHWETLLRARAIENCAFVIAAAQSGNHEDGRTTWGRSMIIDPTGRILSRADIAPSLNIASIDIAIAKAWRNKIPAWKYHL